MFVYCILSSSCFILTPHPFICWASNRRLELHHAFISSSAGPAASNTDGDVCSSRLAQPVSLDAPAPPSHTNI